MIEVSNLVKDFQGIKALDQTTMTVNNGAIYGLVGPNGAGKSTLIRHIVGILKPDSGTVRVDGEPVYENKAIKEEIAYIPDDMFYFLQADTLEMMKFYQGLYPHFDREKFYSLQEYFPGIDVKRNIRSLSKGMQKQVAFWLSICCNPKLLVLDEPVDGLDPVMRRQVWSLMMSQVADRDMTVLVSSHNLRELEDVCDHVGIMNRGQIILERSLMELQGQTLKVQLAFENGLPELPADLDLLHQSSMGRVHTLIIRGQREAIQEKLETLNPLILDILPLTLEEIFIYELGGQNYAVKEILV